MRKCAIFSPYMIRSLVIYDFAPESDPSEFPNIWGKFYFLFYQCRHGDFNDKDFCFSEVISTDNTVSLVTYQYIWIENVFFYNVRDNLVCEISCSRKFLCENHPIISNCRRSGKIFLANHVNLSFSKSVQKNIKP